jgi:cell division protein FtsB
MIATSSKKKKESRESLFFPVLLSVLMLVVVSFLVISNLRINQRRAELEAQKSLLLEQIEELEAKRQELEANISQTLSEDYLEKEARETFNLKKAGEEVVAVLPAGEGSDSESDKGFWQKLWDKIKFW